MAQPIPISKVHTEEDIVKLLKQKDERGLQLVFERYGNAMLNAINKIVGDRVLAEDVLQEVLVKVWKKAGTYEKGKGTIFTWLVSISRNAAIDKTRSKEFSQSKKSTELDTYVYEEGVLAQKATSLKELQGGVREMVSLLDDHEQQLIQMAFFEGYTHVDISKELDLPLGTVKTRIRSAIKKLRNFV